MSFILNPFLYDVVLPVSSSDLELIYTYDFLVANNAIESHYIYIPYTHTDGVLDLSAETYKIINLPYTTTTLLSATGSAQTKTINLPYTIEFSVT